MHTNLRQVDHKFQLGHCHNVMEIDDGYRVTRREERSFVTPFQERDDDDGNNNAVAMRKGLVR